MNGKRTCELNAGAGGVPRRWVSEAEIGGYLGVSVRTLQSWRMRGQGPTYRKLCGAVRYDLQACEQWAESQPGGGAGAAA
jgi:hypothetical protein